MEEIEILFGEVCRFHDLGKKKKALQVSKTLGEKANRKRNIHGVIIEN